MADFIENKFDEAIRKKFLDYEETPPDFIYNDLNAHFSGNSGYFTRRILSNKYFYILSSAVIIGIITLLLINNLSDNKPSVPQNNNVVATIPQTNGNKTANIISSPSRENKKVTTGNVAVDNSNKHSPVTVMTGTDEKRPSVPVSKVAQEKIIDTVICGLIYSPDENKRASGDGKWVSGDTNIQFSSTGFKNADEDPAAIIKAAKYGKYSLTWISRNVPLIRLTINFMAAAPSVRSSDVRVCGSEYRFRLNNNNSSGSWNTLADVKYENQGVINSKVTCFNKEKVQFIWTGNNGYCRVKDTVNVSFNNLFRADVNIVVIPSSCRRNNGSITAVLNDNSENLSYSWHPVKNYAGNTNSISNLYAGEYHLTISGAGNCSKTFDILVPDSGEVKADFSHSELEETVSTPVYFTNNTRVDGEKLQTGTSYKWSFGDGAFSEEVNPEHSYSKPGNFSVKLVAKSKYGCVDSVSISDISISPSNPEAPNVFSPNGDGINDIFKPKVRPSKTFTCTILSRDGRVVYQWNDQYTGWDGKINNSPAPEGTYFYLIKGTGNDDMKYVLSGSLLLVR